MTDSSLAVEIIVDVCDITPYDLEQIQERIEDAIGDYKPTITVTPRTY